VDGWQLGLVGEYPSAVVATPPSPNDADGVGIAAVEAGWSQVFPVSESSDSRAVIATAAAWRQQKKGHAHAYIVADKIDVLRALEKQGFIARAYLPAWWEIQGACYDCVLVSTHQDGETWQANGLESILEDIQGQLKRALDGACKPSAPPHRVCRPQIRAHVELVLEI
jgi:hypothetical protein